VTAVTDIESTDRIDPPLRADEVTTLLGYLAYHRDTFRMKTAGLDAAQLAAAHAPSTMTLGGMMKHLSLVESNWFNDVLMGRPEIEPWASVDWEADRDWEWHTAADDEPDHLRRLFDDSVAASDAIIAEALADGGLDVESVRPSRREGEGAFSLRWILVHMIEEYARHNGHADLIRESIDGVTGE
jgi:uncharacterized damage-inducible protein DinB